MNTKLPKKIYLNYCDEDNSNAEDLSGITWCSEPVTVSDCDMMNREYTDLSQVWHDVEEEPILNQWFIAQIGDDAFDTFIMAMDKNQDWENWSNGINIKKWAYVNDLLSKKRRVMTREEINKLNPSRSSIDITEEAYEMGLIEGLEAADKEPNTSVLWHKQNEEPEEGESIVCIDEDGDLYSGAFYDERVDEYNRVYESAVWDYGTLICYWKDVKMWAYAKDLLPKGSEK